MKRVILSFFALCFAVIGLQAQDKKGAKIELNKEVHNYGTIENGADGTCEFQFKNTGTEDLTISNCRASCGCTIPAWPRTAIKPGETGTIKVKYATTRTGPINKSITITSNAVNAPNKVVKIAGTVKPPKPKAAPAPAGTPAKAVAPAPKQDLANAATAKKKEEPKSTSKVEAKKSKRWWQFWKKKNVS